MRLGAALSALAFVAAVAAQPGGGGGGTACTNASISSTAWSATYSTNTGVFTGTVSASGCPSIVTNCAWFNHKRAGAHSPRAVAASSSSHTTTFPGSAYVASFLPKAVWTTRCYADDANRPVRPPSLE